MAAGDKGGKTATAKLRKVVSAEMERVNAEIQERERRGGARGRAEGRRPSSRHGRDARSRAEGQLKEQAEGLKDEIRKLRDELESDQAAC